MRSFDPTSPRLSEPSRRPRWRGVLGAVPYLTLGLAAANVAAYQAEVHAMLTHYHGDGAAVIRDFGFSAKAVWDAAAAGQLGQLAWRLSTLLTSMFVHLDPNHVGLNVANILVFGSAFELLTRRRLVMLAAFLAGGLAVPLLRLAGLADPILVAGASGALFGVMGALVGSLLRLPESPWDILAWVPGVMALSAFFGETGLWLHPGLGPENIDHLSHVGGFLAGLAVGWKTLGFGAALSWADVKEEALWRWRRFKRRQRLPLGLAALAVLIFGPGLWVALAPGWVPPPQTLAAGVVGSFLAALFGKEGSTTHLAAVMLLVPAASLMMAADPGLGSLWIYLAVPAFAVLGAMAWKSSGSDGALAGPERRKRRDLARGLTLTRAQRRLAADLAGIPGDRVDALKRLASDTASARVLAPLLHSILLEGTITGQEVDPFIDAVAAPKDAEAVKALRAYGRGRAPQVAAELERLLQEATDLQELLPAAEASSAAEDPLLERADAFARWAAGQGFADRQRAEEVRAAAQTLREARAAGRGEDAALAASRLENLLPKAPAAGPSA